MKTVTIFSLSHKQLKHCSVKPCSCESSLQGMNAKGLYLFVLFSRDLQPYPFHPSVLPIPVSYTFTPLCYQYQYRTLSPLCVTNTSIVHFHPSVLPIPVSYTAHWAGFLPYTNKCTTNYYLYLLLRLKSEQSHYQYINWQHLRIWQIVYGKQEITDIYVDSVLYIYHLL